MAFKAATLSWWLLAASYPLLLVLGIAGWFADPRIGLEAAPGPNGTMVITRLHPGGSAWDTGARVGDMLLEIDGVQVTEQTWELSGELGTEYTVLTEDGKLLSDSVESGAPATGQLVIILLIVSTVFAGTSSVIFWRSGRSNEALTVSVLFLVAAVAFVVSPAAARWLPWALHVELLALDWAAALFFIFLSLLVPAEGRARATLKTLRWGMAGWALALDVLNSLSITAFPGIYEAVKQIGFLELGVGLLGGVAFLVAAYVRNESLVAREQLRVMVVGVSAAVAPFLVLSVAPSIVTLPPFVRPEIAVLATVLVPLSFMYALMRRQFMAIRWHVHRGMAYALVGLAVLVIYGGLMAFLGTTGGEEVGDSPAIQGLLLVVLFAVIPFTSGTRRLAFAAVDRALCRSRAL